MALIKRVIAFLVGNMNRAEGLEGYPEQVTSPLAKRAANDESLAIYLTELARKTVDRADAALDSVQSKASTFLTLTTGLLPLALAGAALLVPAPNAVLARWVAFGLAAASVLFAVASAVMASMASGLALSSSVNIAYLEKPGETKAIGALRSDEIDAWDYAALLALESARRKAIDLFRARQLLLVAVLLTLAAVATLAISTGPNVGDVLNPSASPNPTPLCRASTQGPRVLDD